MFSRKYIRDVMKQDTSVSKQGGSFYLRVPMALAEYLDLKEGLDTVEIQDEEGKHGRYASFWAKKKSK